MRLPTICQNRVSLQATPESGGSFRFLSRGVEMGWQSVMPNFTTYSIRSVVETTICCWGCGSLRSRGSSEGPLRPSSQMRLTVRTSHCWLQRGRGRWWPGHPRTIVCTLDLPNHSGWKMKSRTWRPQTPSYATGAWHLNLQISPYTTHSTFTLSLSIWIGEWSLTSEIEYMGLWSCMITVLRGRDILFF